MLSRGAFLYNLLLSHAAKIQLPVELCMGWGVSQVSRQQKQHMYVKNSFSQSTAVTNNFYCDDIHLMTFSVQLNVYEKVVDGT